MFCQSLLNGVVCVHAHTRGLIPSVLWILLQVIRKHIFPFLISQLAWEEGETQRGQRRHAKTTSGWIVRKMNKPISSNTEWCSLSGGLELNVERQLKHINDIKKQSGMIAFFDSGTMAKILWLDGWDTGSTPVIWIWSISFLLRAQKTWTEVRTGRRRMLD